MERQINLLYHRKTKNLYKKLSDYLARYEDDDKEKQALVEKGELSVEDYKQWKIRILQSEECREIIDEIVVEMTKLNRSALEYVNGEIDKEYLDGRKEAIKEIREALDGII